MILLFLQTQQTTQLLIFVELSGYDDVSLTAPKPCMCVCVTVVLRKDSMLKAMQEETIATQTSDYILAQPRTRSFMPPIQYMQYP